MADNLKDITNIVVSENTDYSDPYIDTTEWPDETITPDYVQLMKVRAQNGTPTTIDTGIYTAVTKFKGYNGTTGDVNVTWTDTDANANTQVVPTLRGWDVPNIDPATDPTLSADTEGTCWVLICGTST